MRDVVVATKARDRWFDLEAVRGEISEWTKHYADRPVPISTSAAKTRMESMGDGTRASGAANVAKPVSQQGAPPLDWMLVSDDYEQPKGIEMGSARYIVADVFDGLASLEENSVDLIFTSPPFLALRSYLPADHPHKSKEIGSEATPGAFIDRLLDVVEACDRVLAPHGTLCFELGDTYAGTYSPIAASPNTGPRPMPGSVREGSGWPLDKSLCMVPESFRWALAYGRNPFTGRETPRWRVRNKVPWCRPNPPVGALGDKWRPAHSDVVVACKARDRWFDLEAVRTEHSVPNAGPYRGRKSLPRFSEGAPGPADDGRDQVVGERMELNPGGAPPLDYLVLPTAPYAGAHYATFPPGLVVPFVKSMAPLRVCRVCGEPSRRKLQAIPHGPWQQEIAAHIQEQRESLGFARSDMIPWFPHYKNGDSVTAQVSNWERAKNVPSGFDWRILKEHLGLSDEFDELVDGEQHWTDSQIEYIADNGRFLERGERRERYDRGGVPQKGSIVKASPRAPDSWTDCGHDSYRAGVVLDPFAGSGTTLSVATGHGRDAIGIDLDARNAELALERVGGLFLTVETVG